MTPLSRGGGIAHPLWRGALLVLLVNDHWLKGAGVAPAWLTGKLSDFAGLIVAPCLTVTLTRARHGLARHGCFAAVAVAFAAIKLSPSVADVWVALLGRLGLHWRIGSHWTDLVALSALPLAWRLSRRSCSTRAVERAGTLLGAVACLATSVLYRPIATSVYLVNTTHEPIDVQILRAMVPPHCPPTLAGLDARGLSVDSCVRLQPFEPQPLDVDWQSLDTEQTPAPPPAEARRCDIVLVRMPGLPDSIILWSDLPKQEIDRNESGVLVRVSGSTVAGSAWIPDLRSPDLRRSRPTRTRRHPRGRWPAGHFTDSSVRFRRPCNCFYDASG